MDVMTEKYNSILMTGNPNLIDTLIEQQTDLSF